MEPLVTPVPNLNGNSAEDLLNKLSTVADALRAAEDAFVNASDISHGRNFQHLIKGNDWSEHQRVITEANHAWAQRIRALEDMRDDIVDLATAIQVQAR